MTNLSSYTFAKKHILTVFMISYTILFNGCGDIGVYPDEKAFPNNCIGKFTTLGEGILSARIRHHTFLLPNGKLLIVGGYTGQQNGAYPELCTLKNEDTKITCETIITDSLILDRSSATQLADGNVLIIGGHRPNAVGGYSKNIFLYDYFSNTMNLLDSIELEQSRADHSATFVDGKVYVIGGQTNITDTINTVEIIDVNNFTITTDSLAMEFWRHTATLTDPNCIDCKILITGGIEKTSGGNVSSNKAFLYSVNNQTLEPIGTMCAMREYHSTTVLNNEILIFGGNSTNACVDRFINDRIETLPFLTTARSKHTVSVLSNDRVVLIGGESDSDGAAVKILEIFKDDNITEGLNPLPTARIAHTVTKLNGDSLLIIGGETKEVELYYELKD